jgi:hypothetical protein
MHGGFAIMLGVNINVVWKASWDLNAGENNSIEPPIKVKRLRYSSGRLPRLTGNGEMW